MPAVPFHLPARSNFWIIAIRVAAVLGVALSSFFASSGNAQVIDWNKYCSPKAKTVLLLVDITTPYDEKDKEILVGGLQRIVGQLADGDKIVIRTIADTFVNSENLIERCVPYCPPLSFWEDLFSNCTGGLIFNHKRLMIGEIRDVVRKRLDRFKELAYSEIIGTIAHASNEVLSGQRSAEVYLFSDMIENSQYLPGKVFSTDPNEALLAKVENDALLPKLDGIRVFIFGFGRGGSEARLPLPVPKLNKISEFWTEYFNRAGANAVIITQNLVSEN